MPVTRNEETNDNRAYLAGHHVWQTQPRNATAIDGMACLLLQVYAKPGLDRQQVIAQAAAQQKAEALKVQDATENSGHNAADVVLLP